MSRIEWTEHRKGENAVNVVMRVMQDLSLSLGLFLQTILSPRANLAPSAKEKVRRFVTGSTAHGNPVDIVKAILQHPHATVYYSNGRPVETLFPLPSYSHPPPQSSVSASFCDTEESSSESHQPSTANLMRALFVDETLKQIRNEVQSLVNLDELRSNDGATGYTWGRVLSFRFSVVMKHIIKSAPILWSIITTAAIGDVN